jgi:hypothetical protein
MPSKMTAVGDTRHNSEAEAVFGGRTQSRWPSALANTPPLEELFTVTSDAPAVVEVSGGAVFLRGQGPRPVLVTLTTREDVAFAAAVPEISASVTVNLVPDGLSVLDMGELEGVPIAPARAGEAFAVPIWQRGGNANDSTRFELSMSYDAVALELLEVRPCMGAEALWSQPQLGATYIDIVSRVRPGSKILTPLALAVFRGRWMGSHSASEVEARVQLIPRRGVMSLATNTSVLLDMAHPVPAWVSKGPPADTADDEAVTAAVKGMYSQVVLAHIEYDGSNLVDLSFPGGSVAENATAAPRGALILGGNGADTLIGTPAADIIVGAGAYSSGAGGALPVVRHEYVFRRALTMPAFGQDIIREGFVGASATGAPPFGPLALYNESDVALTALRPWLETHASLALGETQLHFGSGADGADDDTLDLHAVIPPSIVRQRMPVGGDDDTIQSGGGRDIVAGDDLIAVDALLPLPEAAERLASRLTILRASLGRRLHAMATDEGLQRQLDGSMMPDFVIKVRF